MYKNNTQSRTQSRGKMFAALKDQPVNTV